MNLLKEYLNNPGPQRQPKKNPLPFWFKFFLIFGVIYVLCIFMPFALAKQSTEDQLSSLRHPMKLSQVAMNASVWGAIDQENDEGGSK